MKKNLLATCFIIFLIVPVLFSQTKIIPYQELPDYNGSATGSGMFISASMNSSSITLTFEGPADRWFALGLGSLMTPADLLIYGCGTSGSIIPTGWKDGYNTYNTPATTAGVDASQDWNVVSTSTNSAGHRTITATRALNTGDSYDVALSFTATTLNVIWARGATADYTVAYHGSTNRRNGISLPFLSSPTASFSASSNTICAGSSVTYSNLTTGGSTSYNWSFQGGSPASSTSTDPTISYSTPGTYSVVLTASNIIGTNTLNQVNYITVTPTVAPGISVGISAGTNTVCAGSPVTFTTTILNGGSSPAYQWKVNGMGVPGNNPSFTTSSLNNFDVVTCYLLSNQNCVMPNTASSTGVTMIVNSSAPSSVSVLQTTGSNPLCVGSAIGFSASPFNGGSSPIFQWKANGANVGLNSATYTTNTTGNGDIITCVVTSNDPCTTSNTAVSSGITLTVSAVLVPALSISIDPPGTPLCSGNSISFTTNPGNGGSTPSFQWYVNGLSVGTNSPVFSSSSLNNNDVVTCILSSALGCAIPSTVSSSPITLSINPTPASPSITAFGSPTFCPGDSLILSSSSPGNNYWSNNSTASTIAVLGAGVYSLLVSVNSCSSAPTTFSAFVFPVVSASLDPIGPLCLDSDPVNLIGSPSGGNYSGQGVVGQFFVPQNANLGDNNFVTYISQQLFNNTTCGDTATIRIIVNDCTGLDNLSETENGIRVFPNPSGSIFNISGENISRISVFELSGKQVYTSDKDLKQLDLQAYPNGIYFLRIESGSRSKFFRLIKQH